MTDHAQRARAEGLMRAIVVAQQRIAGGYDDDPPNDLVAIIAAALDQAAQEARKFEREVRRRMWMLHYSRMRHHPYGDDGRLDCNTCLRDYATTPLDTLRQWEWADAAALVNDSKDLRQAAQPVWSGGKPTVAGWWWWRTGVHTPEICNVYKDDDTGEMRVNWATDCDCNGQLLSEYDGEWAGPLPLPREA